MSAAEALSPLRSWAPPSFDPPPPPPPPPPSITQAEIDAALYAARAQGLGCECRRQQPESARGVLECEHLDGDRAYAHGQQEAQPEAAGHRYVRVGVVAPAPEGDGGNQE